MLESRTQCWELSSGALDEIGLKVKWKSMALWLTRGRGECGMGFRLWEMEML